MFIIELQLCLSVLFAFVDISHNKINCPPIWRSNAMCDVTASGLLSWKYYNAGWEGGCDWMKLSSTVIAWPLNQLLVHFSISKQFITYDVDLQFCHYFIWNNFIGCSSPISKLRTSFDDAVRQTCRLLLSVQEKMVHLGPVNGMDWHGKRM